MVLVSIHQINTAHILIQSASTLATQLQKSLGVLSFVTEENHKEAREKEVKEFLTEQNLQLTKIIVRSSKESSILAVCEETDALFLFIQLTESNSKHIRIALNNCRDLRIPYILFKDSFLQLDMKKVLLPIGFLEEEMEKAQFASAFGRFCNSEVKLLLANDYGSKAATNAGRMMQLFDKFDFVYKLEKAKKDSFKVEMEAIQIAENEKSGIIIVSASRDYGLDDIIFGPKEYHIVKKTSIPVLLVNPRGDLYALCD
jgi:adenine-specific DNA methylase